jgi:hypothetical protein
VPPLRHHLRVALAIALVVNAVSADGVAAADRVKANASACTLRDARVVKQNTTSRILRKGDRYFGCVFANGVLIPLLTRKEVSYIEPYNIRLAGQFVAFQFDEEATEASYAWLREVDLQTAKRTDWAATSGSAFVDPMSPVEPFSDMYRYALAPTGALAWINGSYAYADSEAATDGCRRNRYDWCVFPYEVHKVDSTGSTVLDVGRTISLKHLRLRGNTLTWKHGRTLRTAELL